MKRFTLILSLLVAMVTTAMAGDIVVSTNEASPENVFTMKNGNGSGVGGDTAPGNGKFAFFAADAENAYYIYSVTEGKWVDYTLAGSYDNQKNFVTLSDTKGNYFNIQHCANNADYYEIRPYNTTGVAGKYLNYFQGAQDGVKLGLWQQNGDDDAGSRYLIEEYFEEIEPEALSTEYYYQIVNKQYSRALNDAGDNPGVSASTAVSTSDNTQLWAIEFVDGKYRLKNRSTGNYLVGTTTHSAKWTMNAEGADLYIGVQQKGTTAKPTAYYYISATEITNPSNASRTCAHDANWANGGVQVVTWDNTSDGSQWAFVKTSIAIPTEIFTVTYNFVYGGNVIAQQVSKAGAGEAYPAFNVPNAPLGIVPAVSVPSGTVTEDAVFEIELTVNNDLIPFEYVAEGTPSVWYYARMHGNSNVTSYIEDNGSETIEWSDKNIEASEIDSHLWGFVGDAFNGFKMVNKGTGDAIASTGDGNATMAEVASATAFHAMASDNETLGAFCLKYKDNDNYINAQDGIIKHWNDNDNGSTFFLTEYSDEEVATVEVSAANYATLFLGEPVYIPAGVEAYVVSGAAEGWAHMEQITGILPANTGVILKNTGNYKFTLAPARISGVGTNLLAGTLEETEIDKEEGKSYYILADGEEGIGFYNPIYDGDATKFNNAANKAYLVVPAEQAEGIACYSFRFGEGTTGVEKVEIRNEKSEIYDLTGRRVEAITAPGIYVVDGKKVLVK